ncbi:LptF/LptG family permease [Rubrivirga litoralis]|uniref:LptF/LptG family permease n=1 Tax=Rubrivirga litoralis TaxID=3075598 RepID=A0ABU3BRC5_9BACT|nr:LptF/LptG family permease [Rubrivirga sp. F394]MDT0631845.1 LptF/LptG family permease [Rubrivirga sp. F394]
MLTRLHRSLLKSLPLPFAAALVTLLFLLLMQFLIRYLPELVGRGLPFGALVELVAYSLAYMLTLAVPMAWLIALLAAFGQLGESRAYLVAKSAGVSLPRLAWPVAVAGLLLTGGMMVFNNQMLPEANYRMSGLWRDIKVSRPGFALTPGEFYTGVSGYAIRADAIPPDSTGLLVGVTVFESRSAGGGSAVLTADRARLQTQYGGQRLTMLLEDGEVHHRRPEGTADAYERLAFGRHRMAFDLSSLGGFERREAGGGRTDRSMRTTDMLVVLDSLNRLVDARHDSVRAALARGGAAAGDVTPDLLVRPTDRPALGTVVVAGGAADSAAERGGAAADSPPDSAAVGADRPALSGLGGAAREAAYDLAAERARAVQYAAGAAAAAASLEGQQADRYRVEIYKKNSIALACLVFVLVGVPLGLSISRAGVGVVAALAVGVFLFYWVSLVLGEKLADRETLPPAVGMWAANVIVGALGVYLVARETRDPAWRDPIRALAGRFRRRGG